MRSSTAARFPAALFLATSTAFTFQTPPKPSLPYKAIENPEFIPAKEATFMSDRDRMIGVTEGKIAKAYPAGILAQHGLVQDKLPDGPIAVTW
jgi:Protein of unknown function (DUF3179)